MTQDTNGQASKARGMALWVRLVLFGSLAMNLAVVGVVLGGLLSGGHKAPPPGRDFVTPYTRAFTEHERREIGQRLRLEFDKNRPERGDFIADYRNAAGLLRQDPFDREAFAAALGGQGARAEVRQNLGQSVLVDYLADMSPSARSDYAERLEEQLDRLASRMNKKDHHGGDDR